MNTIKKKQESPKPVKVVEVGWWIFKKFIVYRNEKKVGEYKTEGNLIKIISFK